MSAPSRLRITPRRGITNATCDGKPTAAYNHYGLLAAPELVHRKPWPEVVLAGDGRDALPRAVRRHAVRIHGRAADRRPRYRDRRRRAGHAGHRRPELDGLSPVPPGGVRRH